MIIVDFNAICISNIFVQKMNLEEDYIDEHTSLNNEYMCRICLENDTLNELIYPCKCSGNSNLFS